LASEIADEFLFVVGKPMIARHPGVMLVHTGQMAAAYLQTKDSAHYTKALAAFRRKHRRLKGIYLIQDGDASNTAASTTNYFDDSCGWWRPRFTPAHASWLNQAELLNGAFEFHNLRNRAKISYRIWA